MRTNTLRSGTTLLALALWGCEGGTNASWVPNSPSMAPGMVASISPSNPSQEGAVVGPASTMPASDSHREQGTGAYDGTWDPVKPAFDIAISTSSPVNLHHVTIRMIDGTNLGGPTITVPHEQLVRHFGSTYIAAGTTRTFRFRPSFEWRRRPRAVAADLGLLDHRGRKHSITVEGPWP